MQLSVSSLRNAVMAIGFLTLVTGCLNERQYDPPTVSVSVSPTKAAIGTPITVTWSSQYAQSCTASGGWSGSKDASGSQSVTLTSANTFTLACTGRGGNASASATVEPLPLPTVTFTGSATKVLPGEAVTLTWSTTNATSCSASGDWSGTKGTSGSEASPAAPSVAPSGDLTYTLTCTGPGGSKAASVSAQWIGFAKPPSKLFGNVEPVAGYPPSFVAGNGFVLDLDTSGNTSGKGTLFDADDTTFTGRYLVARKQDVSWSLENGKLAVVYSKPQTSTGFSDIRLLNLTTEELAKLNASGILQVATTYETTGYTYTRLKNGRRPYSVSATSNGRVTIAPVRLNDGSLLSFSRYPAVEESSQTIWLRTTADLRTDGGVFKAQPASGCSGPPPALCLAGTTWSALNYTDTGLDATTGQSGPDSFMADIMTFNADGTGVFASDDSGFRWTVNADGTATVRGQDGSAILRFADFAVDGSADLFNGVFVELTLDDGTRGATYMGMIKKDPTFKFDSTYPVTASGKFWRAELNNWLPSSRDESGALKPTSVFGWKFSTGGSGTTATGEEADCNGDGKASETRGFLIAIRDWSILSGTGVEDGAMRIRRTNRERYWVPITRGTTSTGERFFYAIELEDLTGSGTTTFPEPRTFIAPRLSKWVEVADAWTCTR